MDVIKVKNQDDLRALLDKDELYELDDVSIEVQDDNIGDDKIVIWGRPYYIEDLGLLVIEGEYCNRDSGNGEDEFVPDWSLTLIYNWSDDKTTFEQSDAANYVYFEQDPPAITIHNYLRTISK